MTIIALGINHKTAPVSIREKVAFDPACMPDVLQQMTDLVGIKEAAILSTCNRTELYCSIDEQQPTQQLLETLTAWLADYHQLSDDALSSYTYHHLDEQAVQHMMRVASGLDSLVLGEPQILGQLKSSYVVAQQEKSVHASLGRLFRQAFSTAKQVRTETAIGQNPVSVAYAAVNMAQRIFADLKDSTALLIGAGETIDLVAKHLVGAGIKHIIVANRTLARAQALAQEFHAEAILLEDIPQYLYKADIVISSTASPLPVLGKGATERALKKRRHQPIFMVDIAVPRDIEPEVAELNDVYLYTVDDLKDIISENVRSRESAAQQAEGLIDLGVNHFMKELRSLNAVDTVTQLRQQVEQHKDESLQKGLKLLNSAQANGELSAENRAVAEKALQIFAHTFSNKVLHAPTSSMRKASAEGRDEVTQWAHELFNLTGKNES